MKREGRIYFDEEGSTEGNKNEDIEERQKMNENESHSPLLFPAPYPDPPLL